MALDYAAPESRDATILQRMTSSGISEARALDHLQRGVVRVNEEEVRDPNTPAPWPTSWVIGQA